jgi:uncharacterized Zn finger protein
MRGREYLKRGQIVDLNFEEEKFVWEARVEGTDLYDVQIEILSNSSLRCECSCPYDLGEHCKHIAAVLYAIEEAFPNQLGIKSRAKPAKRQTHHDKLRQQLEKSSHAQLVSILLDLTQSNRELLNQLLIRLDTGNAMDYQRVVKDALRAGRGEYGFFDYAGSNRAGRKLDELLDQAVEWRNAGEIDQATALYQAVIDVTVPIMGHADDSSGMLGDCINTAIEGLSDTLLLYDEIRREALFNYCLDRASSKDFHVWDWGWDLLTIAEELVSTPSHRAAFSKTLDNIEATVAKPSEADFTGNYALEHIALFRLAIIDRFDGTDAAHQFLRSHVHLDQIRMELIERCIKSGAFEEAMHQIEAGIATSKKRRLPGLTDEYQTLRVNMLQRQGDTKAVITGARALWLKRGNAENFELLRTIIPSAEWPAFIQELIKDVSSSEQRAWLYAQESRWDDLMTLVQSDQHGRSILEQYRGQLEARFPEEVAKLYEKIIEEILARATGRGEYRKAITYLRRMNKIGQTARAQALIEQIRMLYAHRPALQDELSRM